MHEVARERLGAQSLRRLAKTKTKRTGLGRRSDQPTLPRLERHTLLAYLSGEASDIKEPTSEHDDEVPCKRRLLHRARKGASSRR